MRLLITCFADVCTHTVHFTYVPSISYYSQTQSQSLSLYVTDVWHAGPCGNYLNIIQRLIPPLGLPLIRSMLFSSNKVHCGANLPNYR